MATNADADLDAIIRKIRALMRLTPDRGATIEEAQTAAAKVEQLMLRHNLAMIPADETAMQGLDYTMESMNIGSSANWRRVLLQDLAKYHFCRTMRLDLRTPSGRTKAIPYMRILGQPHNIAIVKHLYHYLARAFTKAMWETWRSGAVYIETSLSIPGIAGTTIQSVRQGAAREAGDEPSVSWRNGFYRGATIGVSQRLAQMRAQERYGSTGIRALIAVQDVALDAAARRLASDVTQTKQVDEIEEASALALGVRAAHRIPIRPAIESASNGSPAENREEE